ncbi:MAG: beta-ketoacyl synthase N-terminal-like domain-containing protein [Pseudomonadota bacterium]
MGIHGASWTASAACASGLLALGQAVDCIRLGRQDVVRRR